MSILDDPNLFRYPEGFDPQKHTARVSYLINMVGSSSSSSSSSSMRSDIRSTPLKRSSMYDDTDDVRVVEYHEKKVDVMHRCSQCSRLVTSLIDNTQCCTFECTLTYYKRNRNQYNYCYALITKKYKGNGVIVPVPEKPCDVTVEDYWKRILSSHYDSNLIRHSELICEFNSNQISFQFKNEPNKKQLM